MDNIKYFLKSNKKQRKNEFFPITNDLVDEAGNVVEWELKPLTTDEVEALRTEISSKGNYDQNKYIKKIICASVISPDLNNIELQNSYGVKSAEELITKILDCPGDYYKLLEKVLKLSKLDETFADKIAEAKN
jgi:hypothetical protein